MPSVTNGTTAVWNTWVITSNSASSSATSNGIVWGVWCAGTTISSTSSTDAVWYSWIDGQVVAQGQLVQPDASTLAETEARLAEENRKRVEATKRADELLISQLNPVQKEQFKKLDAFMVELQTKRYEIKRNSRVKEFTKEGKAIASYCIHPNDWQIPAADIMLSQKLMLETDEASFLRIANRSVVQ